MGSLFRQVLSRECSSPLKVVYSKALSTMALTSWKNPIRAVGILSAIAAYAFVPHLVLGQCLYYGGNLDTPGQGLDVAVSGSYAYVADGATGLTVVDISTPGLPKIVGSVDTPGSAGAIALSGSYAYVADFTSGLVVIDISNPASPSIVGSVDTPGYALGVFISGSRAYVADGYVGLHVIDISNPAHPAILGSVDTPGEAEDVVVSGSYAYIPDLIRGLAVVNVSNPAAPSVVASTSISGLTYGIGLSGSYAYVLSDFGIFAVNISNPSSPVVQGGASASYSKDMVISGSYAYVTGDTFSLVSLSNPAAPTVVWRVFEAGNGIAISGPYVWVAARSAGLNLYAAQSGILGRIDTPGDARHMFASGSYAYVGDLGSGLQIVDTSNPGAPTIVGSLDTPGSAQGVWVSGNYAYVADATSGLQVIDVTNPAFPSSVGSFDTPGNAIAVAVSGAYAYVADGTSGLQVVDISNPAAPNGVGSVDTPGSAGAVEISGNYAYIADDYHSFQVIDITNPRSPTIVSSVNVPSYAEDVVVSGSFAYVADIFNGLQIIDISNPLAPAIVGSLDTNGNSNGIAVSGRTAYIADGFGSVIIDVTDPALPVRIGVMDTPGIDFDVAVSASHLFVLEGTDGMSILPLQCSICSVTVDAGGPYLSCGNGCINLNGHIGGLASSATWTTNGTGSFVPNPTTVNAQYCPTAQDIASGSVVLTLTTDDPPGDCGARFDTATLSLADSVSVIIVGPTSACVSCIQIHGVIRGASSGTWSSSGSGRFVAGTDDLENIYCLSDADIAAGMVTLTLTSNDPPGDCDPGSASLTTTFCPPSVEAGGPYQTCGTTCVQLHGSLTQFPSATTGTWSSSGTGTFQPDNLLLVAPRSYCPSAADSAAGSVTITLTAYLGNTPYTDSAPLTITPCPSQAIGLIRRWGTLGSGPGQFNNPYGVAIDGNQIVYVTDETNNRIQKFDSTGVFLGQWGSLGSGPGQLSNPTGIDIGSDGLAYVSDHQNHRICAFTRDGAFVRTFSTSGMSYPVGLDCESSGNLWVAALNGFYRFSSSGSLLQFINASGNSPYGVTAVANLLYGSLCAADRIDEYVLTPFSAQTFAGSGLDCPEGSSFDADGNLWVCDSGHDRILKYDASGALLKTLQLSTSPRAIPTDIAFDINGDLYVTEWGLHRISKYSAGGHEGVPCTVSVGGPYASCGYACVHLHGSVEGGLTGTWSTSGSGTFSDNTSLNAIYCPSPSDVLAGSVMLTLTAAGCPGVTTALTITPGVPLDDMAIDPNTINPGAGGHYVSAHLEFSSGFDPAHVDLATVRLNGTVAASLDFFDIKDWNHNHVPDLTVKFPRDAVEASEQVGDYIPISITGMIGESCFFGSTFVRVIRPHLKHPNGGESYLAGVRTLVEWDDPQGWTVSYAQIYYSSDGGDSWSLAADHVAGTSYVWAAPTDPTSKALLRIVLMDNAGVMGYDSSDEPFTVRTSTTGIGEGIPTAHRLYQNSPNPFTNATQIWFDLPEASHVTLDVFDLTGRKLRVLTDSWFPIGSHEVNWDARDAAGHRVAGGIYFLHLRAGAFSETKRMYLQR